MEKNKSNLVKNIVIILIMLVIAIIILKIAPNYIIEVNKDIKLIVNYTDVTNTMKGKVYIDENDIIYLSKNDISNYYDGNIYYDEKYNQIVTTSETNIATMSIDKKEMNLNGNISSMKGEIKQIDEKYYLPFSDLEDVYNVKATYIKETKTVVLDSLDKKLESSKSIKKNKVKYKPTNFSKTIDKLEEGEEVYIVPNNSNNDENNRESQFIKIKTKKGKIGYVRKKSITEKIEIREEKKETKQIEGKVSLVWEYFSEYSKAPIRNEEKYEGVNVVSPSFFALEKLGKGNLLENIGESGEEYIKWAHSNGYKVWPIVSNNSMKETTSEIMRDYKLRENLINQIVQYVNKYDLDGVNIDFEYMKEEDRDLFSRFIIELTPNIKRLGKVVSVDVTAPDGSPDWSLCFNRYRLGKVADYIMFMAYDQHGVSSDEEGTVAGFDWVLANVNKFLKQEEVPNEKLVLGIPFYTRLWKEKDGKITSSVVTMKNIEKYIPEGVTKVWNNELKQNYIEYEENGSIYKMWLEDEDSIKEKLSLVNSYELAGGCYWVKDFENDNIWSLIKKELNIE